MSAELQGRTALITGSGRGIGAAIATELARYGANLVLLARSIDQLNETAARIRAQFPKVDVGIVSADLGDSDSRAAAVADALENAPIDVLINNAAVVEPLGPTTKLSVEQVRQALEINILAVIELSVALVPGMVENGWGRVVNVSSGVAGNPAAMVGGNIYTTTKAAVETHSRSLAAELDGTGVTVNVYRPGIVDTEMQSWIRTQDSERIGAALHERFSGYYESGALISPQDSAQALLAHLVGEGAGATGSIWQPGGTVTV